jgi:hypothetical protein
MRYAKHLELILAFTLCGLAANCSGGKKIPQSRFPPAFVRLDLREARAM